MNRQAITNSFVFMILTFKLFAIKILQVNLVELECFQHFRRIRRRGWGEYRIVNSTQNGIQKEKSHGHPRLLS